MSDTLVAFFSASGVTKNIAAQLAKVARADLHEIQPVQKYSKEDLNWINPSSRSSVEMKDSSSRPSIANTVTSFDDYQTIYLGFPIWWYVAPTIIHTFLEQYDFSGKKIILFATSGSSGMGKTREDLLSSVSDQANLVVGGMLNGTWKDDKLKEWIKKVR